MKPSDEELEAMARKYCELMWENHKNPTPYEIERFARLKVRPFLALWEATREFRNYLRCDKCSREFEDKESVVSHSI